MYSVCVCVMHVSPQLYKGGLQAVERRMGEWQGCHNILKETHQQLAILILQRNVSVFMLLHLGNKHILICNSIKFYTDQLASFVTFNMSGSGLLKTCFFMLCWKLTDNNTPCVLQAPHCLVNRKSKQKTCGSLMRAGADFPSWQRTITQSVLWSAL